MVKFVDRVKLNLTTTGTGTVTFGSVVDGFQSLVDASVVDADVVRYAIESGTDYEVGTGTIGLAGGTYTMARSPSSSSESDNSAINVASGAVCFLTMLAEDVVQNLSDLDNVSDTTPSGGQTLSWNAGTSSWSPASPSGGITSVGNYAGLPASPSETDLAWVQDTKSLYVYDGTEWDRIYSGAQEMVEWTTAANSSYNIMVGSSSTTISVAATDPDGFGVTYDYLTNPSNPSSATVAQGTGASTNDFSITPDSTNLGNFSLRITASDGVSKVSTVSAINILAPALLTGLTGGTGGGAGATSYTAPGGMVVTSPNGAYSSSGNYYMSHLFNGNTSSGSGAGYWLTDGGSTGYLTFDLSNHTVSGSAIGFIQKVIVYPKTRSDSFTNITSVEWSNDGTNWTQSHGNQGWTDSLSLGYNETFLINQNATYFRLGMQMSGSWGFSLHEVQIHAG